MPQNALTNAKMDYCINLLDMGALLEELLKKDKRKKVPPPLHTIIEANIAERVLSDMEQTDRLGKLVPYSCPACGGALCANREILGRQSP